LGQEPVAHSAVEAAVTACTLSSAWVISTLRGLASAPNEWLRCVFAALAAGRDLPMPPPGAPGPFGLADPDQTRATLTAAGFDAVDLTAVDQPFWLGPTAKTRSSSSKAPPSCGA